ncbi:MAG TPA: single-stranded DNA-binding protein [Blastocatellia bacterium]|nr:single-stranded DNA-binding protein [Blastocatellia bacterium]
MASFNRITIVGYLGRDPELRYTPDGTPVCNFSVATTERKKSRAGDMQDVTTWFRVNLWGRQAEVANQYLAKGKQVYIEGRLSQSEYQDRDGNTRFSLEVRGTDLQFIGSRGDEPQGESRPEGAQRGRAAEEPTTTVTDDDVPF